MGIVGTRLRPRAGNQFFNLFEEAGANLSASGRVARPPAPDVARER